MGSGPHRVTATLQYPVIVTASGWSGTTDELAELLAARFRAPALRWRMALQRGEVEVACPQVQEQALQMAEELRRMGVPVRVDVPPPIAVATGTQVIAAGHTLLGAPTGEGEAAAFAGTVMGRPFGDQDDDTSTTRYAQSASHEAVIAPAAPPRAVRPAPLPPPAEDLWAAALDADAARQRGPAPQGIEASAPSAAPLRHAERPEPLASPDAPALSAPKHGWEAVLGQIPPSPRAAVSPPPEPASSPAAAWDERPTVVLSQRSDAEGHFEEGLGAELAGELDAVARGGDGPGRLDGSPEPPKFHRLSRPDAPAAPRDAMLAALLSLVGPGAGQAYNGEVARGLTFALLAPFGLPWLWSVADAWRVAARQPSTPVPPIRRIAGVGALGWLLVAALLLVWTTVDRLTERPPPESAVVAVAPPRPARREAPRPAIDETPAQSREAREVAVQGLLEQAQAACAEGVWAVCRSLAEQALDQDETNRDARRLHVWAVAALHAESEGSALPADSGGP